MSADVKKKEPGFFGKLWQGIKFTFESIFFKKRHRDKYGDKNISQPKHMMKVTDDEIRTGLMDTKDWRQRTEHEKESNVLARDDEQRQVRENKEGVLSDARSKAVREPIDREVAAYNRYKRELKEQSPEKQPMPVEHFLEAFNKKPKYVTEDEFFERLVPRKYIEDSDEEILPGTNDTFTRDKPGVDDEIPPAGRVPRSKK